MENRELRIRNTAKMAEKSLGMHFVFAYMDFFLYLCTRILCKY